MGSHHAALAALLALSLGCNKPGAAGSTSGEHVKDEHRDEHKDEPEHEELPKRVRVTAEVIAAAKITSAPAAREALGATIELSGEIAADPDKVAHVAPPVAGRIERVTFTEGAAVEARALLAVLRVPDLADRRAALASTSARATAAKASAERLEALHKKGLASAQEVMDARAQSTALDAEARAAAERLRAIDASGAVGSLIELRAPIAGIILHRDAVIGQAVGADRSIATVADTREVWFLARVFEKDLGRVREGAAAEVELNAFPKERFDGTITRIGQQIDPAARTVIARVPLRNRRDLLRLGLFGVARVASDDGGRSEREARIVVPRSALTEIGGKSVVFVQHPDNDFEVHPVVVGRAALGKVEVLSGLREGERVVVEGVFNLKSLVLKSTIAEEE